MNNEQIEKIIETLPDGMNGFLKSWGLYQFAAAVLESRVRDESDVVPESLSKDIEIIMLREDRDGALRKLEALQKEVDALRNVAMYADTCALFLKEGGWFGKAQALEHRIKEAYDLSTDKRVYGPVRENK
jgi:hypothetical protein